MLDHERFDHQRPADKIAGGYRLKSLRLV